MASASLTHSGSMVMLTADGSNADRVVCLLACWNHGSRVDCVLVPVFNIAIKLKVNKKSVKPLPCSQLVQQEYCSSSSSSSCHGQSRSVKHLIQWARLLTAIVASSVDQ